LTSVWNLFPHQHTVADRTTVGSLLVWRSPPTFVFSVSRVLFSVGILTDTFVDVNVKIFLGGPLVFVLTLKGRSRWSFNPLSPHNLAVPRMNSCSSEGHNAGSQFSVSDTGLGYVRPGRRRISLVVAPPPTSIF